MPEQTVNVVLNLTLNFQTHLAESNVHYSEHKHSYLSSQSLQQNTGEHQSLVTEQDGGEFLHCSISLFPGHCEALPETKI